MSHVSKRFGSLQVLDDVVATFHGGRITALVGPNSAGKTTLLKCAVGLITPDSGQVRIGDRRVSRDPQSREGVGYMAQRAAFPAHLTVEELMTLLERLRAGGPPGRRDLYDDFGLAGMGNRRMGTLSGGMRQRVNAAIACRFAPTLLLLDEPTAGLDPVASALFKAHLKTLRDAGVTIVITSHVLVELEELADDVVVLLDGRCRYEGSIAGLRTETGAGTLERAVAHLMVASQAA